MCMDRIGRVVYKVLTSNPRGAAITLGAGGLSIPGHIASLFPEVSQTVVELETNLVDKVIEILPIRVGKPIEFLYGDAKSVLLDNLEAMAKKFDVVVVDIFLGKSSPDYLETLSFCNVLSQISSEAGVVLVNFKDTEDLSSTMEFSKILKKSFMFVETIKDNYFKQKNTGTDILFLASNGVRITDLIKDGTGYETDTVLEI
jgi:spermidine synthase